MKKNIKYRYPAVVGSSDRQLKTRDVFQMSQALCCILLLALTISSSCKKLVESEPPSDYLSGSNVFATDATAIAVLNGLYTSVNNRVQDNESIGILAGLNADELTLYSGVTSNTILLDHYKNDLSQMPGAAVSGSEAWIPLYNFIFKCNAAIEGLSVSESLTPAVKQQLLGEAKFFRAFCFFYLVNLFGDVPLPLTTDPEVNTWLSRSSKEQVFQQIITDLQQAEESLSAEFLKETLLSPANERVRPTKWAATALLARVYLYKGDDWVKAEEKATTVISNNTLFGLPALNDVFLKTSMEAIWQLQPTAIDYNTVIAKVLVIPSTGPSNNNPFFLSQTLLNSFEAGDNRAALGNWIQKVVYNVTSSTKDSVYFSFKYKINTSPGVNSPGGMSEYFMVLRLGEQYLIRAEARAKQNKLVEAQADLNTIRTRAGLPNTTAADQPSLLAAILHERRHEFFCEWGNRWLDLKRTGSIDAVMSVETPLKSGGNPWQPYQALYPLPYTELQSAPNLVQNEGY